MAEEPRPISRQAEPPCGTEPALRLSIFHLMLWTFCSAAYLAWSRSFWFMRTEYPSDYVPIRQAMDLLQSLIIGAVLTGSITLAYAWTHGRAGFPKSVGKTDCCVGKTIRFNRIQSTIRFKQRSLACLAQWKSGF